MQESKQERLLRLKQVLQIIPVSKSTWWTGCASGRFPAPIKLTERTTVWKSSDIDKLVASVGHSEPVPVAHEPVPVAPGRQGRKPSKTGRG